MKQVLLLALSLVLAACSTGASALVAPTEPATPATPQEQWQAANLTHYRFKLHLSCFCASRDQMPLTVEVQDGKVVSIVDVKGTVITAEDPSFEFFSKFAIIDTIFAEIETASASENHGDINVTYDPTLGYPTDVALDYDIMMADEELYLTITDFEQLP